MSEEGDRLKAEYERLRATGLHHNAKPVWEIRESLKAMGEWQDAKTTKAKQKGNKSHEAPWKPAEAPEVEVRVDPAAASVVPEPAPDAGGQVAPTARDAAEWDFIQKCIAELPIPLKGMTGNLFKQMYDRVVMQTKMYRTLRGIHTEVGHQGEFPVFSSLGLASTDGREKPVSPNGTVQHSEPAPSGVTEGQMPMRSKPSREELIQQLGGPAKFDPRPVPAGV